MNSTVEYLRRHRIPPSTESQEEESKEEIGEASSSGEGGGRSMRLPVPSSVAPKFSADEREASGVKPPAPQVVPKEQAPPYQRVPAASVPAAVASAHQGASQPPQSADEMRAEKTRAKEARRQRPAATRPGAVSSMAEAMETTQRRGGSPGRSGGQRHTSHGTAARASEGFRSDSVNLYRGGGPSAHVPGGVETAAAAAIRPGAQSSTASHRSAAKGRQYRLGAGGTEGGNARASSPYSPPPESSEGGGKAAAARRSEPYSAGTAAGAGAGGLGAATVSSSAAAVTATKPGAQASTAPHRSAAKAGRPYRPAGRKPAGGGRGVSVARASSPYSAAASSGAPLTVAAASTSHAPSSVPGAQERFDEPPSVTKGQLAAAGLGIGAAAAVAAGGGGATSAALGGDAGAQPPPLGVAARATDDEVDDMARGIQGDGPFPSTPQLLPQPTIQEEETEEPDFPDDVAREVVGGGAAVREAAGGAAAATASSNAPIADTGVDVDVDLTAATGQRTDAAAASAGVEAEPEAPAPAPAEESEPSTEETPRDEENPPSRPEAVEEDDEHHRYITDPDDPDYIPIAKPVELDDEDDFLMEEGGLDDPEQDRLRGIIGEDVVFAEPTQPDEFKEEVEGGSGGICGWARNHKCLCAVITLAVVGGVAGGAAAASSSVTPAPQPTPSPPPIQITPNPSSIPTAGPPTPTASPTPRPTSAPITEIQALYIPVLSQVSSDESFLNPSSPQGRAFDFIVGEDKKWADPETNPEKVQQRFALATLFYSTGGEAEQTGGNGEGEGASPTFGSWTSGYEFLTNTDECNWKGTDSKGDLKGVTLCENGRVVHLELSENGLTGTFPPEIQAFTALEQLNIATNGIGGSVPTELSAVTSLKDIRAFENSFTGPLPPNLGNLNQLTHLAFQSNKLNGPIPFNIGNCTDMTDLLLQNNQVTGRLPSSLGQLVNLQELFLESNDFTSTVPAEMGDMVSLRNLWLSKNSFTGGMGVFCDPESGISLSLFYADCLGTSFPETPAQVECSCCTICCNEDGDCLPNN
uniref:L domain-like protein n=1 Tax=Odontella aurita TaxID=265563 RepID=A0A7S4IIA8_9STRA|mmetsp:Transcript_25537/g.75256  ORF Transcript_25537/g.75256 Transcript_25537/m.75256 type:complete len:1037 (+) Transcript_25537:141-3251(+)